CSPATRTPASQPRAMRLPERSQSAFSKRPNAALAALSRFPTSYGKPDKRAAHMDSKVSTVRKHQRFQPRPTTRPFSSPQMKLTEAVTDQSRRIQRCNANFNHGDLSRDACHLGASAHAGQG